MSLRDQVTQATRTFAKTHSDSSALTDAQVINGYKAGRQALPYLAVFVVGGLNKVAHDEVEIQAGSPPQERILGQRWCRVEIHGYGAGSEDWLENLVLALAKSSAHATMNTVGVTFSAPEGPRPAWRQKNANMEEHYILSLVASFRVVGDWADAVEAALVEVDLEQSPEGGSSGTLSLDIDVTLP